MNYPTGLIINPRWSEEVVTSLPHPLFSLCSATESGAGKVVLLHKCMEKVLGHIPVHEQTIGDCVSHGWGSAVDVLACVEIDQKNESEEFRFEVATEPIYAGSRVEIGGGRVNGDGSLGGWAAKFVERYGILHRTTYDRYDLRTYSGDKARKWGQRSHGVPDILEPIARQHPVRTVSLVTSYVEARDAIANGYPIPVCSNQGFTSTRDNDGFAKPEDNWAHCMLFLAVDDAHYRPGLLCLNSWGPHWISGPKRHGQPDGSFWVDADTVDSMLRGGDSFAVSNYVGFPAQKINYNLY